MELTMSKRATAVMLLGMFLMLTISMMAVAGNGGSELSSAWNTVENGLQGTWGKLMAGGFVGLAMLALKNGSIIGGIFMFIMAVLIGTIPDIVNADYSATVTGVHVARAIGSMHGIHF